LSCSFFFTGAYAAVIVIVASTAEMLEGTAGGDISALTGIIY